MKKCTAIVLATLSLMACTKQQPKAEEAPAPKSLILYYSQEGATKLIAEEIQRQTGADIEAIETVEPYADNYDATIARGLKDMGEGVSPELKSLKSQIADYDRIFLGYPIWFGTYAIPVTSLLNNASFDGKEVVTFCTFGSGGLKKSTDDLRNALPKAKVVQGYGARTSRVKLNGLPAAPGAPEPVAPDFSVISNEIARFLIEGGYKDGNVEPLPAFGAHVAVTDEQANIFNAACGNYQFPLGTPVDVAVRETDQYTEFEFGAKSTGRNGEEVSSTIYVILDKAEGSKPVFTRVER